MKKMEKKNKINFRVKFLLFKFIVLSGIGLFFTGSFELNHSDTKMKGSKF